MQAQVRAPQDQAWPGTGPAGPDWREPETHARNLVLLDDGRVLAALGVLAKDLMEAGRTWSRLAP